MALDFPIGAILPFAGSAQTFAQQLATHGWARCDGSLKQLTDAQWTALQNVIGDAYGGTGTAFALPDLRGHFLRGVDPVGTNDPDGAARVGPAPNLGNQGNSGRQVGSFQPHGVGPHGHEMMLVNQAYCQTTGDGPYSIVLDRSYPSNNGTTSPGGGDKETRPLNIYVDYIIKYKQTPSGPDALMGSVVYYPGDATNASLPGEGWLPCLGGPFDESYSDLLEVIARAYGADTNNQPYLPDYRGRFLRGLDETGLVDPDGASRTGSRPDLNNPGNSGVQVGSAQADAVAPHTHSYGWPTCTGVLCGCCSDFCGQPVIFSDCGAEQTSTDGTGCPQVELEARPRNLYLEHAVSHLLPSAASPLQIPVGAIIAFSGPPATLNDPDWLLCDGSPVSASTYSGLAAVLNLAFGGDGAGNLYLPDLQGLFVRGVDQGFGRDPDAGTRQAPRPAAAQPGAAGDAVGSYQPDGVHPHTHQYAYYGQGDRSGSVAETNNQGFSPNSTTQPLAGDTGASDTRPVNSYVYFFIKAQ